MGHAVRWRPSQDSMAAPHSLTSAPILPTIWRLSLPNMFAMVATALVSVAETVYVGQLGTAPLAGMALVFPLVMQQQMLSAGSMGGGIASAISRALGSGRGPMHWYCTPCLSAPCWACSSARWC